MLDLGLTTWAEKPDPTRSDSHAWSAHPTADLLTIVAGIEPAARLHARPHPAAHRLAHVAFSQPADAKRRCGGLLSSNRAGLEAEVTLPKGVTGSIALTGAPVPLQGGQELVH